MLLRADPDLSGNVSTGTGSGSGSGSGSGPSQESAEQREKRHRRLFESIAQTDKTTLQVADVAKLLEDRYEPFENMGEVVTELMDDFRAEGVISENTSSEATGPVSGENGVDYGTFSRYLTRMEVLLNSSFRTLDQNRDGRLDIDEVRKGLELLHIGVNDYEIKLLFDTLDVDNDGYISHQEWLSTVPFIPNCNTSRDPLEAAYQFFVEDISTVPEGHISDAFHGLGYFLAGGLAGVISRTATAPFDRLKVFLIAQSGSPAPAAAASAGGAAGAAGAAGAHEALNTIPGALKFIWRQGGVRAFFVGNGLNVFKVIPESAMKFGSFEAAKRMFCRLEGVSDPSELSRAATFLAGGIGGMVSQFTIYPIDTLKFRIQCSAQAIRSQPGVHQSVVKNTITQMWRDGGLRQFYRGLFVGVTGIFPFAALDLGTFSAMKHAFITSQAAKRNVDPSEVELGNMTVLSMGALSGSVGASAVYPINLLRTRLQTQGTAAHPYYYDGFRDVFQKTIKRDGVRGLYRGLGPNIAKVAPAVSISYLVYENTKRLLELE